MTNRKGEKERELGQLVRAFSMVRRTKTDFDRHDEYKRRESWVSLLEFSRWFEEPKQTLNNMRKRKEELG